MGKNFFKPRIGKDYEKGLKQGKKVLVLGASHYCLHNENNDTGFICPVWDQCTSLVIKDSSPYNVLCPYYKSSKNEIERGLLLEDSPSIEVDNYLEGGNYTSYSNFTDFMMKVLGFNAPNEFWDKVAFYNYVQHFLPYQTTPRQTRADIMNFEALLKVIKDLQPDIIIVWGVVVTDHFKNKYISKLVDKLEFRENAYFIDMNFEGKEYLFINPYHPCDARGHWTSGIEGFTNALNEIFKSYNYRIICSG